MTQTATAGPSSVASAEGPPTRGLIWLTTLGMLATLVLGTLVLPELRVPDEKFHADMVLAASEGDWIDDGWPGLGERRMDGSIWLAVDLLLENGRADSEHIEPRSPLEELAPNESRGLNRAAQHPPLFYLTSAGIAWLVTALFGDLDFVQELWSFRLMSVLASAALPVLFYLIARQLTSNRWVQFAAAVTPLAVPGITLRNGAMINNDAVLMLCTSAAILMATKLAQGDLRPGTAVLTGAATGFAMLAKGFGMFAVAVVALAYAVQAIRSRRLTSQWAWSVAVSSLTAIAFGGWWWVRNLIQEGQILTFREVERAPDFVPDWADWATTGIQQIVGSFWGGSFALSGGDRMWLFWLLTVLVFAACAVALIRAKRKDLLIVALAFGIILLVAVPLGSARLYLDRGAVKGVQGRYFYPALAGVLPVVVIGIAGFGERLARWMPTVVVTGAIAMNALALRFMFGQYWSSFGQSMSDQWGGVVLWSPLPSWATNLVLVTTLVVWSVLLALAVWVGFAGRWSSPQLNPDVDTSHL